MNKKKLIYDLILIAALITAGLLVLIFTELSKSEGSTAVVSINGNVSAEYSLSEDGEYSINGGTNILVISEGKAFLKEASCPDKLCVRQRSISKAGERIVCLPNRVMVEISGEGEDILPS